ncbi:MAG: hypothetical protein PHQ22_09055 [Sulfuricurvum sp.]|nr:hypothetical protein [Sulfuricurvum sp.]
MTPYEIALAIIQVVVIGALFAIMRRSGKKPLIILLVVMLMGSVGAVIYYQLTKEKPIEEMNLNELFNKYSQPDQQKACAENVDACKEFYIGANLQNTDEQLALKYLIAAYDHNVSGLIDDPKAQEANLTASIAVLYRHLEPDHIWATRWYEKSIAAGREENLCVLGEMLMEDHNISKARDYLIRGDAKNLSACTSHLGQLYFEKSKKIADLLWMKAYMSDPYGKEVNYYLGNESVRMDDLQMAKYHYIIALKQLYKTDQIDIYDNYNTGIALNEIDASPLFVERILKQGKFNIDPLKRWFEIVLNDNHDWKSATAPNSYVDLLGSTLAFTDYTITLSDTITNPETGLGLNSITIQKLYELIYGQTPNKISTDQSERTWTLDRAIKAGMEFNYEGAIDGNFTLRIVYTPKNEKLIYEIVVRQ